MWYLILKAAVSGFIIAVVSEVAQRLPALGALIASLPLVSVLAMIWLYADTRDIETLAQHSSATFWFVLPSLPMFLVLPVLLRDGMPFAVAMGLSCALTVVLYLLMVWGLKQFGITL
jgi:hypothetical protein